MSARIDNDLHRRFCLVSTRFGVSDTQMITDALTALCDYAIERGRYERPMKMVFDKEQAELLGLVAEPPGGYQTTTAIVPRTEKKSRAAAP